MSANPFNPFPENTSNVQAVFPVQCPLVGESWSIPRPYVWCRQPDEGLTDSACVLEICCVPAVQTEWPVCLEPQFVPEPTNVLAPALILLALLGRWFGGPRPDKPLLESIGNEREFLWIFAAVRVVVPVGLALLVGAMIGALR